jgi:hypothetical protein
MTSVSIQTVVTPPEPERANYQNLLETAAQLEKELRSKVQQNNSILAANFKDNILITKREEANQYDYEWRMCCLGYKHERALDWQTVIKTGDFGSKIQYYSVSEELAEYESWLYSLDEAYKYFWRSVPTIYIVIEKDNRSLVILTQSSEFDLSRCTLTSISNSSSSYRFQSGVLKTDKALILINSQHDDHRLSLKFPEYHGSGFEKPDGNFRYIKLSPNTLQWSATPIESGKHQFVISRDNTIIPHKEIYPTYSCTCDLA